MLRVEIANMVDIGELAKVTEMVETVKIAKIAELEETVKNNTDNTCREIKD